MYKIPSVAPCSTLIYKVVGDDLSPAWVDKINAIDSKSKIKDRIAAIEEAAALEFYDIDNSVFRNNLLLIDSALPRILADLVYTYYTSSPGTLADLVERVAARNPLSFDSSKGHPFYSYKIKRFLTDVALGMRPNDVWTGRFDTSGGMLIVREDGEVICYHIYNRNDFEDYLLNNTKFDTPSSTRHGFGTLYATEQGLFFKLNVQIRFV